MPDHATSADPVVQAQLDRLWALSPGADVLGLGRITRLLEQLDNPERNLPPVFHVAGTNGKGSTCAFLRASLEAAGHRVHAYTSPHLVRFNERIRIAGHLIDDGALAALLAEVLDRADGIGASFFEVTTAAALLAFARTPADACVIEVGLGGRLDATNVVKPVVCGIASLGIDHQSFLGDTIAEIAAEKAGIAKAGVPLVTLAHAPNIAAVIAGVAGAAGAPLVAGRQQWFHRTEADRLVVADAHGTIDLPLPVLAGAHQADNLALAAAMLRQHQTLAVPVAAIAQGARAARWPARLQRLDDDGPLVRRLPADRRRHGVWLDGAHNVDAAAALAKRWTNGAPTALVIGMLANKDAQGVLAELVGTKCEVVAVPVEGHDHHEPAVLASIARDCGAAQATTAGSVEAALDWLARHGTGESVLVAGSLYLAGHVLQANEELPS